MGPLLNSRARFSRSFAGSNVCCPAEMARLEKLGAEVLNPNFDHFLD